MLPFSNKPDQSPFQGCPAQPRPRPSPQPRPPRPNPNPTPSPTPPAQPTHPRPRPRPSPQAPQPTRTPTAATTGQPPPALSVKTPFGTQTLNNFYEPQRPPTTQPPRSPQQPPSPTAQHPAPDSKCGSRKNLPKTFAQNFRTKRFGQNVIGTQTLNNFYKPQS